ncbi:MAG: folK [Herminiimonas sp.]|nr:folK [Herminiimonas sp.]MDB5855634.1 folK [Herminiimonas sp.]
MTSETNALARAWIGIGSNLGNAEANVRLALAALAKLPSTRLETASSLFRSAPVDADGADYVNAVARVGTRLSAHALLAHLHGIEKEFGRERTHRNAPRTLDLDILLYGDSTINSEDLVVPHPRMSQRAFVLLPLLQIDPFISLPGLGPAHTFVPSVAGQTIQRIDDSAINSSAPS